VLSCRPRVGLMTALRKVRKTVWLSESQFGDARRLRRKIFDGEVLGDAAIALPAADVRANPGAECALDVIFFMDYLGIVLFYPVQGLKESRAVDHSLFEQHDRDLEITSSMNHSKFSIFESLETLGPGRYEPTVTEAAHQK
jgi:hypothetical protein